jgi:hypothetical protein
VAKVSPVSLLPSSPATSALNVTVGLTVSPAGVPYFLHTLCSNDCWRPGHIELKVARSLVLSSVRDSLLLTHTLSSGVQMFGVHAPLLSVQITATQEPCFAMQSPLLHATKPA